MSYQFAPYQDDSPAEDRAKSPPPRLLSPSSNSHVRSPTSRPHHPSRLISEVRPLRSLSQFTDDIEATPSAAEQRGYNLEVFQTSLPIRLDYEAMLAYLLLPPAGGIFLLLFEHKSDYVRFHAWQSSMLFSAIFLLHLLLSWSKVLSWMLLAIDLVLIGFLSLHAYRDVENLEHYQVPLLGWLANSFVDDE